MPASLASDWNIAPLNGLAQVKGRTDAALSNAPIHHFLLEAVQRFADRPAVVFREQGIRWTWAQLQAEAEARWPQVSSRWACAWVTAWASHQPR